MSARDDWAAVERIARELAGDPRVKGLMRAPLAEYLANPALAQRHLQEAIARDPTLATGPVRRAVMLAETATAAAEDYRNAEPEAEPQPGNEVDRFYNDIIALATRAPEVFNSPETQETLHWLAGIREARGTGQASAVAAPLQLPAAVAAANDEYDNLIRKNVSGRLSAADDARLTRLAEARAVADGSAELADFDHAGEAQDAD